MGGGTTTTTQQTSEPWRPAQPQLIGALGEAGTMFKEGGFKVDPFAGPRIAGFGDVSQEAQSGILDMARGGAPMTEQASGYLSGMMDPSYQSEQLEAVKQNVLGSVIPAATAAFSGTGMLDSTPAMDFVGRAATEAIAPYEYGAYQAATDRGMQAAGMAPGMDVAGYMPAQMIGGVGAAQDELAQQQIAADMAKYYEEQGVDLNALRDYTNFVSGIGGMGGQVAGTSRANEMMGMGGLAQILGAGIGMFA